MQVAVYLDKILAGEFRNEELIGCSKIFEIDYTLKNLLDAFSRNLCWFLG
jgi:hypothetical protein